MNTLTCSVCGATLQTSGDVCAEASAKGWEVMDGGARCKKCCMAGNSGNLREIPGNSRLSDAEIDELEKLAGEATPGPWGTDSHNLYVFTEDCVNICEGRGYGALSYQFDNDGERTVEQICKNIKYIAAANPAAVLSLIAEVRAARAAGKD